MLTLNITQKIRRVYRIVDENSTVAFQQAYDFYTSFALASILFLFAWIFTRFFISVKYFNISSYTTS